MKIRLGFVSNSSSSSFVVAQAALTEEQIQQVMNYMSSDYYGDAWNIIRDDHAKVIRGFTIMDNGDLSRYMREVCGIDTSVVAFEDD